jgi:hypothetical protein
MGMPSDQLIIEHNRETCEVTECDICKHNKPFVIPEEIIDSYKEGNLVIFAGAGISTEATNVYDYPLKNVIKEILGLPEQKPIDLPKLLSLYCQKPRSRKDLLRVIKHRIDYVKEFRELYFFATKFHRELSTIPHLNEIVTTNWDDFFEKECSATPIVTGQDFAVFQDIGGRKVFKLHGSVYNYGSIVATEEDYQKCYKRLSTGIIGANLKVLLMSKTLLFTGFSFQDNDFQRLYRLLRKDVSGLMPASFVVTLEEDAQSKLDSLGINAVAIITDASFFLKQFKARLIKEGLMLPDKKFDEISGAKIALKAKFKEFSNVDLQKFPDGIYMHYYYDGLFHMLYYLLDNKSKGENSCKAHMFGILADFDLTIKKYLTEKNFLEAAYLTGRMDALVTFLKGGMSSLPVYFLYGYKEKIKDFNEYLLLLPKAEIYNKIAHKLAREKIGYNFPSGMMPHHAPFT